jgi:hypothetical protein
MSMKILNTLHQVCDLISDLGDALVDYLREGVTPGMKKSWAAEKEANAAQQARREAFYAQYRAQYDDSEYYDDASECYADYIPDYQAATAADSQALYRTLIRTYHPDRHVGKPYHAELNDLIAKANVEKNNAYYLEALLVQARTLTA